MTHVPRLTSELRSDLVAYLDGELDEEATQRVETALAANSVVRREVEMLTRTWEMLDVLPQEKASEDFTAKTLETIVLAEHEESIVDQPWYQALRVVIGYTGWFLALATVAVLAFLTTYRWIPHERDALLNDFPVIRDFDRYRELQSIEYLERLNQQGRFYEDRAAQDSAVEGEPANEPLPEE